VYSRAIFASTIDSVTYVYRHVLQYITEGVVYMYVRGKSEVLSCD
jgi:hypothetical protein